MCTFGQRGVRNLYGFQATVINTVEEKRPLYGILFTADSTGPLGAS